MIKAPLELQMTTVVKTSRNIKLTQMCGPQAPALCREVGSKTWNSSTGAVWVFGSGYSFMFLCSRVPVVLLLRLMERRVGGGRERSRKHYHGNPQPLTEAKLVLLECVSVCFPGASLPGMQTGCRRYGGW